MARGKQSRYTLSDVADLHQQPAALYHSVGSAIRSRIQDGEWAPGQQIPSERELMDSLKVSRSTIRQGLDFLVREGVLQRVQGRGTFVAPPKIRKSVLRLLEFSDVVRDSGHHSDVVLIGKKRTDPPGEIRQRLGLASGAPSIWLQRLLVVDQAPLLIETAHFPPQCERVLREGQDDTRGLRDLLADCGVQVYRAQESFEPVILEDHEAALLEVKGGSPGLWVESLAYDAADRPVAFVTSLFPGNRCRFVSDLTFS